MSMEELIGRINFLYKKSNVEGLTPEEKLEQQELREEYIGIIKGNFRAQLNTLKKVSCR
ncbi:DUF896 domain-containing protein [Haloimpatiens lingqiaonensis]|uniref:DUF896 domain-containing protein n=1 Tax=Haloimpatiens lingqiaonensis TaxID=1380675 RepID=UPI0010FD7FA3|nr:DUF896 domain-containing protein [Haloimpatiens lingqiaonensis]